MAQLFRARALHGVRRPWSAQLCLANQNIRKIAFMETHACSNLDCHTIVALPTYCCPGTIMIANVLLSWQKSFMVLDCHGTVNVLLSGNMPTCCVCVCVCVCLCHNHVLRTMSVPQPRPACVCVCVCASLSCDMPTWKYTFRVQDPNV